MQEAEPDNEYVPDLQKLHLEAPLLEKKPAWIFRQEDEPDFEYVPDGQSSHIDDFS